MIVGPLGMEVAVMTIHRNDFWLKIQFGTTIQLRLSLPKEQLSFEDMGLLNRSTNDFIKHQHGVVPNFVINELNIYTFKLSTIP